MDSNYQLINSVDPSKCRAKIRDKFAKLTLSSNKKKQEDAEMQQQMRENATLSNVSRNLLNDLLTDDESEDEKVETTQRTENRLMRTNSSPSDENLVERRSTLQSANTTHCTEAEESEVMEPLHVSETDNTQAEQSIDKAIERLSSRVSELTVEGPVTISSGPELTQIVSTEHQRMIPVRRILEETPTKDEVDESICISSGTEESAITISDSSQAEEEFEVNVTPSYYSRDHKTLDAAKDDRMAKFLHDVKKNYGLPCTPERDFEDRSRQIAMADTEPMSSETLSQSIGAARRIASAETQSMSHCEEFTVAERDDAIQNTSRGLLAAADTEDMTKASETMMSSLGYEPVMKVGTEFLDNSVKNPQESLPDDSLTIAGTSEEEQDEEKDEPKEDVKKSQQALRESNSPAAVSKRSSSSEQDSQFQINISAKINIKIQFSQQQDLSSSSNSTAPSPPGDKSVRESLEGNLHSSAQKTQPQPNILEAIPQSPPVRDVPDDTPVEAEDSPDEYEKAERLLNELYGNAWKTPEVLNSLKKSTVRRKVPKASMKQIHPQSFAKDETFVGEFSIFRQNITHHLDSTRLVESPSVFKTPRSVGVTHKSAAKRIEAKYEEERRSAVVSTKPSNVPSTSDSDTESEQNNMSVESNQSSNKSTSVLKATRGVGRCPRSAARRIVDDSEEDSFKAADVKTKSARKVPRRIAAIVDSDTETGDENASVGSNQSSNNSISALKTPVTAVKVPRSAARRIEDDCEEQPPKAAVVKTKSGREVTRRIAAIIDSDIESEGENASDGSNQSWKKSPISEEDEDIENKPKAVRKLRRPRRKNNNSRSKNEDDLVYLDLSKDEIEIQHNVSTSPPANNDANFSRRLEEILKTCKAKDKPKIECTPGGRPKRKLFTANINDDDEFAPPPFDSPKERLQNQLDDDASVSLSGGPLPSKFEPFNKHLAAVKSGLPIFKIQTPKSKRDAPKFDSPAPKTPKPALKESRVSGDICITPKDTYSFLKSLDLCVGKSFCHPDALYYRDNYRLKKDELANKLYDIYNRKCFNGELDVPLKWNKKLTNTAGRCMNKRRLGERTCVIELSEKVLTSADRLRCTLIHELCHAATWIFNGEGGHGASWKAWARKANQIFPELPKIGVCHQYDIEYKYTYKCTLCGAKSHAHSKSKKVENIRCSYCHGAIEIYLNKKDKEGNVIPTPVKEPAGFAKFVKEKYKTYKRPDLKHADVMKLLSSEFASMKMDAAA